MANSIYTTLDTRTVETSVPGQGMIEHSIPAHNYPDGKTFEDGIALLAWAEENGYTHAMLQKGIKHFLIEDRAAFKATKKDEEWTFEKGQTKVNERTWEITERPNQKSAKAVDQARYNDCMGAIANMIQAKVTESTIGATLGPVYGDDMVATCIDTIKNAG